MKTSKFVLVTPDYPPARGGVARYLGNLVSVSGGEIRVIVSERHPTEGPGKISHAKFVGKGWPAWAPLIRVFRSIADEVAVVSHVFPFGTAAWIARKIGGAEYVILLHGLDVRLAGRNSWKRWLFQRICSSAKQVIANSHATAEDAERLTGEKPVILTPGVERFAVSTREDARRSLNVDPNQKIVLSVTRLVPRKGIDIALRAMSRIQKEENVEYVILGDGEDFDRLQKTATEHRTRVRWIRRADDAEKWNWFAAADVFLLPVRDEGNDVEGFGIVFLEAALAGVPSVAGKSGGAKEAVVHDRTGLMVSPMDVGEVTDAVARLLKDGKLRNQLGTHGRERAEKEFRWEDRWKTFQKIGRS
ncbi:glycosyltransferase family 4 protein [Patescibacteria group bacterium]|nr:glycosyltransferase family 4 protein [Patescibacteria group bacterium]